MTLTEAFAAFKAQPTNIRWSTVAICADGSFAAALWDDQFKSLQPGILSHVSRVSEWGGTADTAGDREWFRMLPEALANRTPIRLIVAHRSPRDFSVRPEMVGCVTLWDGENLQIDFKRASTTKTTSYVRGITGAVKMCAASAPATPRLPTAEQE